MSKSKLTPNSAKILKSLDQNKDQSYFLWQIKKKYLGKILFPIGDFENKSKVREFAVQNNLITANKKDSQGLCFVGQTNVKEMLWQILGQKVGLILTIESKELENSINLENKIKNQNQNPKLIIKSQKTLEKIILQIDSKTGSKSSSKNTNLTKNRPKNSQNINLIEYKILKKLTKENIENIVRLKKYFIITKSENCKKLTKIKKNLETKALDKNLSLKILDNKNAKINTKKPEQLIIFYQILSLHSGAFVYTIGQRQGLNLSGGPWFVSLIDINANTVFVSDQSAKEEIYTKKILVKNLNWQNLPNFG